MRKLRTFIVELILVGLLLAWYAWKFPETLDPLIPWILWAIFAHLTWEIALERETIKTYVGGIAEKRRSFMVWLIAFAIGGLISIGYLWLAEKSVRKLTEFGASHKPQAESSPPPKRRPQKRPPTLLPRLRRLIRFQRRHRVGTRAIKVA